MNISNAPRPAAPLHTRPWTQARTSAERWTAQARAVDLQVALPTIDASASSQDLMAFFATHASQCAVAVLASGLPIGLVSKANFVAGYVPQRRRTDDASLSCLTWLTPRSLIVDAQAALPELLLRAHNEGAPVLDEGIIVTDQGRYLGLASGLALRTAVLDLQTRAQSERLAGLNFALPMQQHLNFVSREHLERGLDDHHVVHESCEPVTASSVFVRSFERGTLAVVLDGRNQGQGCFRTNVLAQLRLDAYVQLYEAYEAPSEDIDPGQWLQQLHVHLMRDLQARDTPAGIQGDDLAPRRLGDGLKIAALWLPKGGRSLRFAGSHMSLLLTRPGSRETQVLRGAFELLGNGANPDDASWAVQDVQLDGVHRALVVTDAVLDQCGGPRAEALGISALTRFLRSHASFDARDIGPILADFIQDWRGIRPAPEDLTALVCSVGASH
jgi:hypothetical protein